MTDPATPPGPAAQAGAARPPAPGEVAGTARLMPEGMADARWLAPSAASGEEHATANAASAAAGGAADTGRAPGRAVPLMLVPGYMLDDTLWDALRPALAAGPTGAARELVHVALAGGETIEEMARAALQASPEGRFDLLGFSMGGYVARKWYGKRPSASANWCW
ncbi:esterase/lipase family protein [Pseudoduganella sp. UC29_106]|uniref:esterase/lipase family protein n=1 Tax=Pseudoduganella sp. UC29_106 TaxID=3374553 RepID=UPI003756449E